MNIQKLTESEMQSLDKMSALLGRCVMDILVRKKNLNTDNVLSQIVTEMERASDNEEFQLYRKVLEFVGTIKYSK
ncbi:Biofilm development protein YmgB/AriR [Serratia sp. CC22-02]|uniref:biofilm development regulator YmgB/AriR family protein n=1 Tax=Serratia sp. CC22-02 TaxID=1378076 RepID=UPI0024032972|nr:biofilm development regulator YmgB/AriR family protein [Serratia sp. CC22-02]SMP82403.1 Biofilm development protein YmgB/AriR [Serratia sp. CC22-02]